MKVLAVCTENFSLYYDLVRALKSLNITFISLAPTDEIPSNVGAIITTKSEGRKLDFQPKIEIEKDVDIHIAITEALRIVAGKKSYDTIVIGIDPGARPGIAVIGDRTMTLAVVQADSVDSAIAKVKSIVCTYARNKLRVRIGHGVPTLRNRIINAALKLNVPVEVADETATTTTPGWYSNICAARQIALTKGKLITTPYKIEPSAGELRDIQRISRLRSNGAITISKSLAARVAKGELTLETAIDLALGRSRRHCGHKK
jgi:hypothetical protein